MRTELPNQLRPAATAEQRAQARIEAWQAEERLKARRGQAARRRGAGNEGHNQPRAIGRSSAMTPREIRALMSQSPSGGSVRAAGTPSVVGFVLSLLMLIGLALVMGLAVLLLALVRLISLGWKTTMGRVI